MKNKNKNKNSTLELKAPPQPAIEIHDESLSTSGAEACPPRTPLAPPSFTD